MGELIFSRRGCLSVSPHSKWISIATDQLLSPRSGDISIQGGGLLYLSDSTTLGKSIEKDFTARAASFSEEERISAFNANMSKFGTLSDAADDFLENKAKGKGRWLTAAYEAGDVVFHDPYAIHGSSKNQDPQGRIRLSTDLRFYEEGSDIDQRWMKYWTPGDGL